MNPLRPLIRCAATLAFAAVFVALAASSVGCGSDETTTTTAPVGVFTPDDPTPEPASITLLPGTTSGASVNVRVTVTDVSSFFGAGFRIAYDPTALLFGGMDSSTSFLSTGITDTSQLFFFADATNSPGEVVITATRVFPAVPVTVTTTSDLVILNFVARLSIPPGAEVGRLDFADPKQACDGTVAAPGCGAITVTWSGGGLSAQ